VVGKAASGSRPKEVRDEARLGLADALPAFRDGSSAGVEGLIARARGRGLAVRVLRVAGGVMTHHGAQGTAARQE
jgi:hypothetical protein